MAFTHVQKMNHRTKQRAQLVAEAGGFCRNCLASGPAPIFSFHHIEPADKTFGLDMGAMDKPMAALRNEADKCLLLCHCCHTLLHSRYV